MQRDGKIWKASVSRIKIWEYENIVRNFDIKLISNSIRKILFSPLKLSGDINMISSEIDVLVKSVSICDISECVYIKSQRLQASMFAILKSKWRRIMES